MKELDGWSEAPTQETNELDGWSEVPTQETNELDGWSEVPTAEASAPEPASERRSLFSSPNSSPRAIKDQEVRDEARLNVATPNHKRAPVKEFNEATDILPDKIDPNVRSHYTDMQVDAQPEVPAQNYIPRSTSEMLQGTVIPDQIDLSQGANLPDMEYAADPAKAMYDDSVVKGFIHANKAASKELRTADFAQKDLAGRTTDAYSMINDYVVTEDFTALSYQKKVTVISDFITNVIQPTPEEIRGLDQYQKYLIGAVQGVSSMMGDEVGAALYEGTMRAMDETKTTSTKDQTIEYERDILGDSVLNPQWKDASALKVVSDFLTGADQGNITGITQDAEGRGAGIIGQLSPEIAAAIASGVIPGLGASVLTDTVAFAMVTALKANTEDIPFETVANEIGMAAAINGTVFGVFKLFQAGKFDEAAQTLYGKNRDELTPEEAADFTTMEKESVILDDAEGIFQANRDPDLKNVPPKEFHENLQREAAQEVKDIKKRFDTEAEEIQRKVNVGEYHPQQGEQLEKELLQKYQDEAAAFQAKYQKRIDAFDKQQGSTVNALGGEGNAVGGAVAGATLGAASGAADEMVGGESVSRGEYIARMAVGALGGSILGKKYGGKQGAKMFVGSKPIYKKTGKNTVKTIAEFRAAMPSSSGITTQSSGLRKFKTPIHMADGSRISGINPGGLDDITYYGYDKNGAQFTVKDLDVKDMVQAANKKAEPSYEAGAFSSTVDKKTRKWISDGDAKYLDADAAVQKNLDKAFETGDRYIKKTYNQFKTGEKSDFELDEALWKYQERLKRAKDKLYDNDAPIDQVKKIQDKIDSVDDMRGVFRPEKIFSVSEIVDHKELYKAEPWIKDLRVRIIPDDQMPGYKGSFDGTTIDLAQSVADDPVEALSTILHETQHGIQDQYKWSRGGSTDRLSPEDLIDTLKLEFGDLPFYKKKKAQYEAGEISRTKYYEDVINTGSQALPNGFRDLKVRTYKRLGGEQEARATQAALKHPGTEPYKALAKEEGVVDPAIPNMQGESIGAARSEADPTGQKYEGFFSAVVKGDKKFMPSKPFEYMKTFGKIGEKFKAKYDTYAGNFDTHIATSIPAFRDSQVAKGEAIIKTYPDGATMIDLGGSEGGFVKTITSESNGKIKTTNLDANWDMKTSHDAKPVKGSDFAYGGFMGGWKEGGGIPDVVKWRPAAKVDVVHESMLFQFVDAERASKVKEVSKHFLKDDGIFITEQKFNIGDDAAYKANEKLKSVGHKTKYYTKEQLSMKTDEVLMGMEKNQANYDEYYGELLKEFKYVSKYWESGNFKGLVASNNKAKIDSYLENFDTIDTTKFNHKAPYTAKDIKTARAKEYSDGLALAKRNLGDEGSTVDLTTAKEAQAILDGGGTLLLTKDGKAGAYVKGDGYMGGLFRNPTSNFSGAAKMLQEGRVKYDGKFFDSFATNEDLYIKNGYTPIARMKFNPEYAPKGWAQDRALKSKPDNVFFVKSGEDIKDLKSKIFTDYDEAYAYAKRVANRDSEAKKLDDLDRAGKAQAATETKNKKLGEEAIAAGQEARVKINNAEDKLLRGGFAKPEVAAAIISSGVGAVLGMKVDQTDPVEGAVAGAIFGALFGAGATNLVKRAFAGGRAMPTTGMPPETPAQRVRRAMQDNFARVEQLQRVKTQGDVLSLPDSLNPYQAEILFHGRAESRMTTFRTNTVEPLMKNLADSEYSMSDLDDYLHARHAVERNQRMWDNGSDLDAPSGLTNDEAADIISELETPEMKRLAKYIDGMNEARLRLIEEEGLEPADLIGEMRNGYDNYVPLQRDMSDKNIMTGASSGKGFTNRAKEFKRARGSERDVLSPTVMSMINFQSTLVRSEKNKVGRSFLNFIEEYPDSTLYEVQGVKHTPRYNAEGEVVGMNPHYQLADNVMHVKIDGKIKEITIKDPAMAAAFKNLNAAQMGATMQVMHKGVRFLAGMSTSYNPEFIVSNFFRDIQTALANSPHLDTFTEAQLLGDVVPSIKGIWDKKGEWGTWFRDFESQGGKTGWMDMMSSENEIEKIVKQIEMLQGKRKLRAAGRKTLDAIDNANTAVENGVRLAFYRRAVEGGMSKKQAAAAAKDMTVNFNKKGEMGTQMNTLYMFANASLQGSTRMLKAIKSSKKAQGAAVGLVGLGAGLHTYNESVHKEEWARVPQYVKDTNIVMMLPDGSHVKMPLPYGYNVFKSMGDMVGEKMTNGEVSGGATSRFVSTVANAFNPIGTSDSIAHTLTPTLAIPLFEIEKNVNFFGGRIMPDGNPYGADTEPDSQKFFKSATGASKAVAAKVNELTGGNVQEAGGADVSPETMDYMVKFLGGGLGTLTLNAMSTGEAMKDEDRKVDKNKIPFARRFYGEPKEKGAWYAAKDAAAKAGIEKLSDRERAKFKVDLKEALSKQVIMLSRYKKYMREFTVNQFKVDYAAKHKLTRELTPAQEKTREQAILRFKVKNAKELRYEGGALKRLKTSLRKAYK